MATLKTMYPGAANSPDTYLSATLVADGAIMYVIDGEVFGPLPTLAVIGDGPRAETVLVKAKRDDGGYDIQRAVEGIAKRWDKMTAVARNFTNKDYESLVANVNTLNDGKAEEGHTHDGLVTPEQVQAWDGKATFPEGGTPGQILKKTPDGTEWAAEQTVEVVNNLDSDSTTGALSAAQGKELKETINALPVLPSGGTPGQILAKTIGGIPTWVSQPLASPTANGLMRKEDKAKLDGIEAGAQQNTITSVAGKVGAVTLDKADVGLGDVVNQGIATKEEAEAGEVNNKYMTPLRVKQAIDAFAGDSGPVTVVNSFSFSSGGLTASVNKLSNGWCYFGVYGQCTSAGNWTMAQLPEAFRPKHAVTSLAIGTSGASSKISPLLLNGSGIGLMYSRTSGYIYNMGIYYLAKDA